MSAGCRVVSGCFGLSLRVIVYRFSRATSSAEDITIDQVRGFERFCAARGFLVVAEPCHEVDWRGPRDDFAWFPDRSYQYVLVSATPDTFANVRAVDEYIHQRLRAAYMYRELLAATPVPLYR